MSSDEVAVSRDVAEEWRPVPGVEGLFASNLGRVRTAHGTVLAVHRRSHAADAVEYRHRAYAVNWCLLSAFVGPPEPDQVPHPINGDKHDHRPGNLQWATRREARSRLMALMRARGHNPASVKLSDDDAAAILEAFWQGMPRGEIYATYEDRCGREAIKRVLRGQTYAHVYPEIARTKCRPGPAKRLQLESLR